MGKVTVDIETLERNIRWAFQEHMIEVPESADMALALLVDGCRQLEVLQNAADASNSMEKNTPRIGFVAHTYHQVRRFAQKNGLHKEEIFLVSDKRNVQGMRNCVVLLLPSWWLGSCPDAALDALWHYRAEGKIETLNINDDDELLVSKIATEILKNPAWESWNGLSDIMRAFVTLAHKRFADALVRSGAPK